jgi:hypothetical protein
MIKTCGDCDHRKERNLGFMGAWGKSGQCMAYVPPEGTENQLITGAHAECRLPTDSWTPITIAATERGTTCPS